MISARRLRAVVSYDEATGIFRWKMQREKCRVGDIAGRAHNRGYWRITIDGRIYLAHVLAWIYVYGKRPLVYLDHRDTNRMNNAISNLREATKSQNNANKAARKDNKCGLKGVTWRPDRELWRATATKSGKQYHLGYFDTKEAAHSAYAIKAKVLFGEFARA